MADDPRWIDVDLTILSEKVDLPCIIRELFDVRASWKNIGIQLGVQNSKLETIQLQQPTPLDCLTQMLVIWLRKGYDVEQFGQPTWRKLVQVVHHQAGGDNPSLAMEIAKRHRAGSRLSQQEVNRQLEEFRESMNRQLGQFRESMNRQLGQFQESMNRQLGQFQESMNRQLGQIQESMNRQIGQIQESMNRLDEKLQKAIECFLQLQKGKLSWTQTSKAAPMIMIRGSTTTCRSMTYFRPGFTRCILSYNSDTEEWSPRPSSEKMPTLPACPKEYFSLTVVNGLVTAVGGWLYPVWLGPRKSTNTLVSLVARKGGRRKWVEHFPPMPTKRDLAAVVCSGKVLVVAGGVQEDGTKLTTVEVMNTDTLEWSTASSLPHALYAASATVCGDCIYLVGGCGQHSWTTSVFTCSLSALLQSQSNSQVWDTITDLPVTCSTCATLNEQVVAVGGRYSDKKVTNNIYSYKRETNSWEVISHMPTPRYQCLVAVLPHNKLMVVGGWTGTKETDIVETAKF